MNEEKALTLINQSLQCVLPDTDTVVDMKTHLTDDGVLDSLDMMSFLFELEQGLGRKIEGIDDDFTDFRVEKVVGLMLEG